MREKASAPVPISGSMEPERKISGLSPNASAATAATMQRLPTTAPTHSAMRITRLMIASRRRP